MSDLDALKRPNKQGGRQAGYFHGNARKSTGRPLSHAERYRTAARKSMVQPQAAQNPLLAPPSGPNLRTNARVSVIPIASSSRLSIPDSDAHIDGARTGKTTRKRPDSRTRRLSRLQASDASIQSATRPVAQSSIGTEDELESGEIEEEITWIAPPAAVGLEYKKGRPSKRRRDRERAAAAAAEDASDPAPATSGQSQDVQTVTADSNEEETLRMLKEIQSNFELIDRLMRK